MSLKSFFAKIFALNIYQKTQAWASKPIETQQLVFEDLIRQAKNTQFGIDHNFNQIKSFEDFSKISITSIKGISNLKSGLSLP